MTSVRGQDCPPHRAQASEAFTDLSSVKSNDDHKDPLESNKPGLLKAPSGSEALKAPFRPPQVPPPMILTLIHSANGTYIELFRRSSRPPQRMDLDLRTSSRLKSWISIAVDPT